tara:strand:+ start:1559 stop:1783 length:225 start_codon:yes stop_codon:yes gene_type:complete
LIRSYGCGMKIGDLVKIKSSIQELYGHSEDHTGIIVDQQSDHPWSGGAWVLWCGEIKPRLFASLTNLEIINGTT